MMIKRAALVGMSALVVFGCSNSINSQEPVIETLPNRNFRVSVKSNGRPVEDFRSPLVHRIDVSPEEIRRVTSAAPGQVRVSFRSRTEFDLAGKARGFRVQGNGARGVGLGLQDGDIVTAVGRHHVRSSNDLWYLFDDLKKHGEATLTLERNGKPHKVLYYASGTENS